jgi:hypothetical protein
MNWLKKYFQMWKEQFVDPKPQFEIDFQDGSKPPVFIIDKVPVSYENVSF